MMSCRSDVEVPKGASVVGYIPYIIITSFVVLVVVLIKFACYFLCYFWLSFLYKSLINFLGYGQTLMSESMRLNPATSPNSNTSKFIPIIRLF